jgi:hypothetical protein
MMSLLGLCLQALWNCLYLLSIFKNMILQSKHEVIHLKCEFKACFGYKVGPFLKKKEKKKE